MTEPTTPPNLAYQTVTAQQVTEKAVGLLAQHPGLFIGEDHQSLFAMHFVTSNMAALKKAGVTTLYIEWNAYKVQAAQGGQACREQFMGPSAYPAHTKRTTMQTVIEVAQANGLRVIGYDSLVGNSWQWDRFRSIPDEFERVAISPNAMNQRDAFATQVIQATHDHGKYLVYGGAEHSQNDPSDPTTHRGLDARLTIPSIDFHEIGSFSGSGVEARPKGMLRFRLGVHGDSTFTVDSIDPFASRNPDYKGLSSAEVGRLSRMETAIRKSGACQFPKGLIGADYVNPTNSMAILNMHKSQSPAR